jgi:hypothetical protein
MKHTQNNPEELESYVCNVCGAGVSIKDKFCPKCGADVSEIVEEEFEELTEETPSERYPALRTIAMSYRILAWLVATVAAIGLWFALMNLDKDFGTLLLLSSIIGGAIGFITLLAASESIEVFIDIEKNTRRIAEYQSGRTEEQK